MYLYYYLIFNYLLAPPSCNTRPMYLAYVPGEELIFGLDCIGMPPPTYQWFKNGILVPGQTRAFYFERSASYQSSGTYSCVLKNMVGEYTWTEATIYS